MGEGQGEGDEKMPEKAGLGGSIFHPPHPGLLPSGRRDVARWVTATMELVRVLGTESPFL